VSWLLALLACGTPEAPAPEAPEVPVVETRAPARPAAPAGAGEVSAPPTVVLVVLDTVRADHLGACGYDRPTSPVLQSLVPSGQLVCDAISPAPWTLPSHASFFTGAHVLEHGAQFVDEGVALRPNIKVHPLPASYTTLAERFRDAGYQTVLASGNPILHDGSGLTQGFDHVRHTVGMEGWLRGPNMAVQLREMLGELDPSRPLFLTVNVFDAHDPYDAIPAGVDWLPRRKQLMLARDPDTHPYVRFHDGRMKRAEKRVFLERIRDGYDYGVFRADRTMGEVLTALEEGGWLGRPHRLAITSDHGESLGEHNRLRHAGMLWEELVRVPLFWRDTSGGDVTLDGPVSTVEVHDLLLHGRRPPPTTPIAVCEPASAHPVPGMWGVAVYDGTDKHLVTSEGRGTFDLAADPGELTRVALGPHAEADAAWATLQALSERPPPAPADTRALRELGYVE
jgi:arylsulfatase